jgi:hypothetical protein
MKNYVLIGDIHSQYLQLQSAINYIQKNIDNYHIIFLGDLFDSRTDYSNSIGVYELVRELQTQNKSTTLQSNHQDKLIRYLKGNQVYLNNGLDRTVEEFKSSSVSQEELLNWLNTFPYGIAFKDKNNLEYRCSHAYFSSKLFIPEDYLDEYRVDVVSKQTKSKCLYGVIHENKRFEWWNIESPHSWVRVAGHYHKIHIDLNNTKSIVLDGSCGSDDGKLYIYDVNSQQSFSF